MRRRLTLALALNLCLLGFSPATLANKNQETQEMPLLTFYAFVVDEGHEQYEIRMATHTGRDFTAFTNRWPDAATPVSGTITGGTSLLARHTSYKIRFTARNINYFGALRFRDEGASESEAFIAGTYYVTVSRGRFSFAQSGPYPFTAKTYGWRVFESKHDPLLEKLDLAREAFALPSGREFFR